MNGKLNLTNLPEGFNLVNGGDKEATVSYTGANPKIQGQDGVFQQIIAATGAASATRNAAENPHSGLYIELALER